MSTEASQGSFNFSNCYGYDFKTKSKDLCFYVKKWRDKKNYNKKKLGPKSQNMPPKASGKQIQKMESVSTS